MQLDEKMSLNGINKRKSVQKWMESIEDRLIPDIEATTFPDWVFPEIAKLGINGL